MNLSALSCQRAQFSLPADQHYLNCAYMGPLPRVAQEAAVAAIGRRAAPANIVSADFFHESNEARALFARMINAADPQRVAILPAVSYGIATAALNLPCTAGQNIVIAAEQFPANVYAWRRLAWQRSAHVRAVASPVSAPPRAQAWTDAIIDAIDESTAIVALPNVHWTDGTRFDLQRISARARDVGAAFVIDGSQSIGALEFDVQQLQPDAVLCAAYKWLLGPYSMAFGWFGPRFDNGEPLEETWLGREGSEDFQGLVNYRDAYQPGAIRYDVGERSNFQLMPAAIASLKLLLEWGTARIQQYCDALCRDVIEEALAFGYTVEPAAGRGAHLFGLRVPPGTDLRALHAALQSRAVFASLRGTALRVSPHVYNDARDVDALRAVLRSAVSAGTIAAPT